MKTAIHLPALFAQLGSWRYFTTVMRLEDVQDRISFADEIAEIRPGKQLSDLIQRALTEGRSAEIAAYLIENEDRFFNSLVVAVYGGDPTWIEFDVKPARGAVGDIPEWAASAFGFLHLSGGETLFALDGQHRLAGIKEALKQKAPLGDERVSVLFVSHALSDEGRRRTRKLFTTLNKTAKAVNKSEIIALDESDTGAIITRRLVEEHPFFCRGQVLAKWGAANLSATDGRHFMTIINLYDIVSYVLTTIVTDLDPKKRALLKDIRPDDRALEEYQKKVAGFFEAVAAAVPELKEYFAASDKEAWAIIMRERHERKNVLFRAVGWQVFTRLASRTKGEGGWRAATKRLGALPRRFTDIPYRGVLYEPTEERIAVGRTRLTIQLLLYMLGEDLDAAKLRKDYAAALGTDTSRLPRRVRT
jgi:DNA sulfur modification protein DndB